MSLTMRQWRKVKERSQEYMAKHIGVHVNTYINWEKEPERVKVKDAQKIAEVLDVPLDEIIFSKEAT